MTIFSGEPISSKTANAACGGPQGGGMDSRRNGVAEISPKYLAEAASNTIPIGYKQTEVGVIPEDWDVGSIESTCPQGRKYGIVDGPFGSNLKTEHYRKSGIPIISSGFVTEGKFSADDYIYVDESKFRQEKRSAVQPGDIVMAKIGARCGASAILPKDHQIGILSGNALKITVDETRHSTFFIWQILWNLNVSGNLDDITTTGAQPAISMSSLKKYVIPQPPKPEQTAIANALSDVDALISELEKLIAKKQAIKTATMQQLLTGRTRLPQFAVREDGTPKGTKPSELGEIPEDWEVVELGKLLAYEQPTNYLISHTKFLDEGLYPVLTAGKSFILGYTNEEYGVFTNLPVIIFDDFTTDSKFVDFPFKAKSSAMKMLKPINKNIPLSLIYNLLNSVDYLVGDHKRHWIGEFQFLNVAIPSKENEQTAIATILSDMDAEIQALEQRLGKTRQIKQGMMQELLTGKTRLVQPQNKECQHG